jgi:hypothetical protein
MIVFNLRCGDGHTFEEWFASTGECETRTGAREVDCPECGDTHVAKVLSAPRINGGTAAPAPSTPCGMRACGAGACQMMGET